MAYTRSGTSEINLASVDLSNPNSTLTVLDDLSEFAANGLYDSGLSFITFKDFDLDIDPADGLPVVTILFGGGGFGNYKWNGTTWDMLDSNSGTMKITRTLEFRSGVLTSYRQPGDGGHEWRW